MTRSSLALLTLVATFGCKTTPEILEAPSVPPPDKVENPIVPSGPLQDVGPTYAEWVTSLPDSTSADDTAAPDQPQYDEGTLGIQSLNGANQWGVVESWHDEGANLDEIEGYHDIDPGYLANRDKTRAVEKGNSPIDYSDFEGLYQNTKLAPVKCTTSDTKCLAEDIWSVSSVPAYASMPIKSPAGSSTEVFKIVRKKFEHIITTPSHAVNPVCSATPTMVDVGWRYRVRHIVNTQVIWTELWFLTSDWEAPDLCNNSHPTTSYYDEYKLESSTGPGPRKFVKQLQNLDCGGTPPAWCNACGAGASDCDYTRMDMEWWQQKP